MPNEMEELEFYLKKAKQVVYEVKKTVVGKDEAICKLLMAILAKGHILIEDIPGVGKTTMALAFSKALGLECNRLQFTPDIMPSDLTGFNLYNRQTGQFEYKPGAVLCVFIDWRMAPCLSDAIQWAGWIWRGQVVWDKMTSRPQKGRYRQQSEYMLWASNGPLPIDRPVGCLPGVFRYTNPAKRIHVTEKPLQLMRDIVHICVPGGRILDPFAGAGTTILAAVQEGYEAGGVEVTDAYYRLGGDRVRTALAASDERMAEASNGEQGIQLDAQKR